MSPADLAVQYDISSVYKAGTTGSGQSIGIISASNVDLSLVSAHQSLFGLTSNLPQVVVDGSDPGQNSASTEAYLDLEEAAAMAPGATVILYTSGGSVLTNGLEMAALRAVEDDVASVLSVSYSACEEFLGSSGNSFWNAVWQQAAAQGQSVFVATGDSGSAGCDDFSTQSRAYYGLAVNGLASTPYNIAVGGSDLYYSQYAGSSSAQSTQLATYWGTSSSTSAAVSLKQTVSEQAWNDEFGYNLNDDGSPASLSAQTIVAGGGGASSQGVYSTAGVASGYPKPAWQSGTGVPSDAVRDLPDLVLFAGDGANLSYYPICASAGDCSSSNLNSAGAVQVTGVGGTSAATPVMAAIQALVNQSTGSWAGQANTVYYALAAKQSSVFRDITLGNNRVLCYTSTSNCTTGSSATNSSGYNVESGYSAGTGYDQATGLGTVDVANLIKYWNTVSSKSSTVTLSVSPTTTVHGKSVVVSGTVAGSGGTPSGSVTLLSNDGLSHSTSIDVLTLSAGSFYATIDNLPGGTYQLTASYGGDGSFAAAKSAAVTVSISAENNTLSTSGWVVDPYDLYYYPLTSGMTIPYGAQLLLDAQPVSANATLSNQPTPATGSVSFSDLLSATTTTASAPLNASGIAEWNSGIFAPGTHSLTASYAGDASYNASTASIGSVTVIQGSTTMTVKPLVATVAAGATVSVDVQLATGYLPLYGSLPTGSVTVQLGTQTQTISWQSFGTAGNASLEAVATFTSVPSGMLPVTATYAGDSNWLGSSANGGTVIALSSKATPTVTLTASSTTPTTSQSVTLTATVAAASGKATPTGSVLFVSDDGTISQTAALSSGKATLTMAASALANGSNIFTAIYQGNGTYTAATSSAVTISVSKSDFSLTLGNAKLQIAPAASATSTLALVALNGFSGAVTLTATAPSGITASFATSSVTLSSSSSVVLTLTTASTLATGQYTVLITATGGGHIHTAQLLVSTITPAAPVFSLAAGTYNSAQSLTISEPTTGAVVYYTTDGSTPTSSSTLYTASIAISSSMTVKAIAIKSGLSPSPATSATYTLAASTPVISLASGTYNNVQSATITTTTTGANIYYTTNGSTPTASSTKYTGAISITQSETLSAVAIYTGFSSSNVASATYTLTASTPVISLAAGTYSAAQSATISTTTTGASIYYTTDGTTPTASSTRYTGAIAITQSETLKAIAICSGFNSSSVASASYVLNLNVATPTFSLAAGTYNAVQSVTLSTTTTGASIYYTTDGSTPTTSSTKYTAAIAVKSSMTIKAIAALTGYTTSSVASASYVINLTVATPTFSVAGGTYTSVQSVTLGTTTTGATIYYTTNGATPTTSSTKYTAAISVSASKTIKAIGVLTGYTTSSVASASYVINLTVATPVFTPAAGTYNNKQSVTLSTTTTGATIYYTINGATPTTSSTKYTTAIAVSSAKTIKAIGVLSGYTTSAVASASYAFTVATPSFSVSAGTYSKAQSVTLSCATTGATIYYTTNGSTPTTSSSKYSAAISVSATKTIKAIAVLTGYTTSSVASASYTIGAVTIKKISLVP